MLQKGEFGLLWSVLAHHPGAESRGRLRALQQPGVEHLAEAVVGRVPESAKCGGYQGRGQAPTQNRQSSGLSLGAIQHVSLRSQHLPLPERLAPRPTRPGTLDLTAANLIVNDLEMHSRIVSCAQQITRQVPLGHSFLTFKCALQALLQCLHAIHAIWRCKTVLTPSQCELYRSGRNQF